jgi:phosphatidyl-myo-inositol dimannoside synthase
MKLLITLDFPPEIGGIQRYLSDIVRHTFSSEDMVLVGCVRKPRGSLAKMPARIVWVSTPMSIVNKKFSCIPLFLHFLKTINTHKNIDEIACGNVYAGIVPWIASFFREVKYSVYTHGTEILSVQKHTARAWILKRVLKRAHRLYSNSHYTALLVKKAGIMKEAIIISPRVEIPLHRENTANKPNDEIPQILCVGRLVSRKGFYTALESLALLPGSMQWKCVIVGDGPQETLLRALSSEKKIDSRVIFKKCLSEGELSQEFDCSTLFVLPGSNQGGVEGFGIVLIEAMAHRVPVIAGNIGGVAEVLDSGKCGKLVNAGDAAELSREIERLLADAPLRERLAAAAFDRVKRQYAW